ncbi:MAG: sigma-70 family RNA polymerase sigma factor, partial [Myxococcota bacterium]|nr:sigma-70 family RNA polymerase sigma factor [Myxococcota bacterium]
MTARVPGDDGVGDLVRRARDGDGRAFEDLVRRYRPRIFALALHVTGSEPDADDVAQEVFLRAYRSLQAFEGRGGFFNWIYRIALHLAFDRRREHARRAGPSLDDPRLERAVAVDAGGNPQRAAAIRQIYRRLLAAMDALSPTLRATIILVCLQGMSHPEAAAVLGTTPGTIAWRIHEARAQLRAAVTAAPGPRPPPPPA